MKTWSCCLNAITLLAAALAACCYSPPQAAKAAPPAPQSTVIKLKQDEYRYLSGHTTLALDQRDGQLFLRTGPHFKYCKLYYPRQDGEQWLINTGSDLQGFKKIVFIDDGMIFSLEVKSLKISTRTITHPVTRAKRQEAVIDECTCICTSSKAEKLPETDAIKTTLRIPILPASKEIHWDSSAFRKVCDNPLIILHPIEFANVGTELNIVTSFETVACFGIAGNAERQLITGPLTMVIKRLPEQKEILFLIDQKRQKITEFPYIVDFVPRGPLAKERQGIK